MKRKILCGTLLLLLCGCSTMNNTESGAIGGGLLGGGIGALFGLACHRPVEGAAIGAAVGAGTGALVGHSEDQAEKRQEVRQAQAVAAAQDVAARAPRLQDIVDMTRNHVAEENIIMAIRTSGAYYQLNAQDLDYLTSSGVSPRVIAELQSRTPPGPYGPPPSGYYYGPPPPGGVVYVRPRYYYP
jgi:outer membrane lipoprotein SlyB